MTAVTTRCLLLLSRPAGGSSRRSARVALLLCLVLVFLLAQSDTGGLVRAAAPGEATEEDEDFYAVLGLEKEREDATERDIKTAWRKLSKKHHPDVAGESERTVYQRIQRAYEILGDRKKRKVYDILGAEGLKNLEQPQQQQMHPFFQFFGGGRGTSDRGEDLNLLLVVPLEDVYNGEAHTMKFTKTKICRACRGTGAKSREHVVTCPHCQGSGRVLRRVQIAPGFVQQMEQPCPHCGGQGKHITEKCNLCGGKKVTKGIASLSVDVEAGLPEGYVLNYELEADQKPGEVPGDLHVTVVTAPHERFERRGNDLLVTVQLTLKEALLGFEKELAHLDGHTVTLSADGVTQHRAQQRIVGEGAPRHHVPSERGDLLVTYEVKLPQELTPELREALESHFV